MVEIVTLKKNRFGRSIVIKSQDVHIDMQGHALVNEDIVSAALIAGFELVDKSVKFTTEEDQKHVEEVSNILESAKAEAAAIVAAAEKQASEIIAEAERQAGIIKQENRVDEKAAKKAELESKRVDDLKALCADAGMPEDQYKNLKKAELVDLLVSFIFEA